MTKTASHVSAPTSSGMTYSLTTTTGSHLFANDHMKKKWVDIARTLWAFSLAVMGVEPSLK